MVTNRSSGCSSSLLQPLFFSESAHAATGQGWRRGGEARHGPHPGPYPPHPHHSRQALCFVYVLTPPTHSHNTHTRGYPLLNLCPSPSRLQNCCYYRNNIRRTNGQYYYTVTVTFRRVCSHLRFLSLPVTSRVSLRRKSVSQSCADSLRNFLHHLSARGARCTQNTTLTQPKHHKNTTLQGRVQRRRGAVRLLLPVHV